MLTQYFDQVEIAGQSLLDFLSGRSEARDLFTLKQVIEHCQVAAALIGAYSSDYPLIEARELQPPFDASPYEYKDLPGFSMVALDRPLDYQAEIFQFDMLKDPSASTRPEQTARRNLETFLARLPRQWHAEINQRLGGLDITSLEHYPQVLNYLFHMDRGHLIARSESDRFRLLGVFASFPCNLDREIKSFGFKIGKFKPRDNQRYERNRLFVYTYLMELFGLPIASERRTSAALFSRMLSNLHQHFFVSVLGNSDRTLTFLSSRGRGRWPLVEKIALVGVDGENRALLDELERGGFFIDPQRRVVIFKVTYTQHHYNPENVVEDRALSVEDQEIIHPRTGRRLGGLDVLKTEQSRLIRLNDIVRGEFQGQIIYRGREIIHGTEDHNSRLKFLGAWLAKHRRHLLSYAERTFSQVCRTLDSYLGDPALTEEFARDAAVYQSVVGLVNTLKQEYELLKVKQVIEDGDRLGRARSYKERLAALLDFLSREKELVDFDQEVFAKAMFYFDRVLERPYFIRRYLNPKRRARSAYEREVLGLYREVLLRKSQLEWRYYRSSHASSAV